MPGPALLPIHWEALEDPPLPALLSRSASVSEGIGEPLELSLKLVLANLSVNSRSISRFKTSLALAAHEEATHMVIVGV